MRVRFAERELRVPYPAVVEVCTIGRWKVMLRLLSPWARGRGDWPTSWRDHDPPWPGPIFRWWRLGPVDVWRFREPARRA